MKRENLRVCIVPSGVALDDLEGYIKEYVGSTLSDKSEIRVNKVNDGYSVILPTDVFEAIASKHIAPMISNMFRENLPDVALDVSMVYFYISNKTHEKTWFVPRIAVMVLAEDSTFKAIYLDNDAGYVYRTTKNLIEVASDLKDSNDPISQFIGNSLDDEFDGDDDDDDEDDDGDTDEIGYGDADSPFKALEDALRAGSFKKGSRKSKKPHYAASKSLRAAKNPKRAYRRHGVIIVKDKSRIKADEKIIKEFLKDFIPGNADWKKKLRKELAARWVHVFAITTKQLKKLERRHSKTSKSARKNSGQNTQMILDATRKIFNVPIDNWSNPNK